MINKKNNSSGFAALYITVLVMAFVFAAAMSMSLLTLGQQRISRNVLASSQSYFAAEAGLEDALLRLSRNKSWSSPYNLSVGSSTATTTISGIIGGSRTITAEGNSQNRFRKIQVAYAISSDRISFHYGAQVGNGGMVMGNGSKVIGNIFSNGDVVVSPGNASVTDSIIVAGNGHKIEGLRVGGDATVHTCKDSTIGGMLTYVSGGSVQNCTAGVATSTRTNDIDPILLPISAAQINEWKNAAASGGVIPNDVLIGDMTTMGPVQIGTLLAPKNLTVDNGETLKLNGTIYVTGNITFDQNSIIQLEGSYGALSGVIIADGVITVENGTILQGSGQPGSYMLIISDKTDPVNPVINVRNNAAGAIFYTNAGLIYLKNNMRAREITGYKIQLENGAEIQYESGLENANFSNGPGGTWEIASWREVE